MDIFLNAAQQIPEYKKLDKYLDDHNTLPALVTGVSHIHKAHIIGALLQKPKLLPVLVIAESEAESQRLSNDINMMYGAGTALLYPEKELLLGDFEAARREKRRPILVNGYAYPSINTNSLNCVLPFLTFLSPFSYKLTPTAELVPPDDSNLIFRAQRSAVMPIMVVTNIFDEGFSTEVLSVILASEELQERLIGNILSELTGKNYYGVNMDIEYIAPDDRERYNAFLERLTERLHNEGFIVMSALAPKISADQPGVLYEAHDYAEQGRIVDYVIIMTYEWGYTCYHTSL